MGEAMAERMGRQQSEAGQAAVAPPGKGVVGISSTVELPSRLVSRATMAAVCCCAAFTAGPVTKPADFMRRAMGALQCARGGKQARIVHTGLGIWQELQVCRALLQGWSMCNRVRGWRGEVKGWSNET